METKGLEPSTFALRTRRHRTEGTQPQQLTSTPESACTNACTSLPESEHADGSDAGSAGGPHADGGCFAEAVAVLMRLPLTDAEKAEAVRRMLADQTAKGKP